MGCCSLQALGGPETIRARIAGGTPIIHFLCFFALRFLLSFYLRACSLLTLYLLSTCSLLALYFLLSACSLCLLSPGAGLLVSAYSLCLLSLLCSLRLPSACSPFALFALFALCLLFTVSFRLTGWLDDEFKAAAMDDYREDDSGGAEEGNVAPPEVEDEEEEDLPPLIVLSFPGLRHSDKMHLFAQGNKWAGDHAVVLQTKNHRRCLDCSHRCRHRRSLPPLPGEDEQKGPDPDARPVDTVYQKWIEKGKLKPNCVSKKKVDSEWDEDTRARMDENNSKWIAAHRAGEVVMLGSPEIPENQRDAALLFLRGTVVRVSVPNKDVPKEHQYDGHDDTVLRLNKKYLFSWSLLDSYWVWTKRGPASYHAFWGSTATCYVNSGGIETRFTAKEMGRIVGRRYDFQDACVNFIALMEIDYRSVLCPCGGHKGIVLDGTKLFVRSAAMAIERLWYSEHERKCPSAGTMAFLQGLLKTPLVEKIELFTRISRYDSKTHKAISGGPGLSPKAHGDLCAEMRGYEGLHQDRIRSLAVLLESPNVRGDTVRCSTATRSLLRSLGSEYPVADLLKGRLALEAMDSILLEPGLLSIEDAGLETIRRSAPHLFRLIMLSTDRLATSLTEEYKVLLRHIAAAARAPFVDAPDNATADRAAYQLAHMDDDVTEDEFFRTAHFYGADRYVRRDVSKYKADRSSKSRSACRKFYAKGGVAGPGFFMVHCLEHGKLLGFHLMKYAESARTVHELLYTRWDVPPHLVIYDNGCNLSKFVLAREPQYYQDVIMVIDRLHKKGHTACSEAFDSDAYPWLRSANTQLAEQFNARLVNKRAQLFFMSQTMFLIHIRMFCYLHAKSQ
jgi:hypothetical protein